MGGTVAVSLLPHPNISAIITMSTAHTLPPARLDRPIDSILSKNWAILREDPTPILSLCGGATDLLVPAESCFLPGSASRAGVSSPYRRTVFTSALEGAWTGIGHLEMVWCHQVRWRVARATIELAAAAEHSPEVRGQVLDRWLRDGHIATEDDTGQHRDSLDLSVLGPEDVDYSDSLTLRGPPQPHTYLLPVPSGNSSKFALYLSRGSIDPISPHHPLPLRVSVHLCPSSRSSTCPRLQPTTLKLVPEPVLGRPFPVPDEGSDESEGVVVFAADVPSGHSEQEEYIAVTIEGADGRGWVMAGFVSGEIIVNKVGVLGGYDASFSDIILTWKRRFVVGGVQDRSSTTVTSDRDSVPKSALQLIASVQATTHIAPSDGLQRYAISPRNASQT